MDKRCYNNADDIMVHLVLNRKLYILPYIFYNIMADKRVIMKVWKNKARDQKLVTVPKECYIKEGDYVEIKKVK